MEGHTPPSGDDARSDDDSMPDNVTATATERRKKARHRAVALAPEVRFFAPEGLEVRRESQADTDVIVVRGSAIVYGAAYRVVDLFGEFEERIHAGSATDLLARGVDCRFLFNHDGMPLGRTTSRTLTLIDGPNSLDIELRMDARQQLANDLAIAFERGDVSQMSVGMIVGHDAWGEDGQTETRDIYGLADLLDVSAVTFPCSPTTHIEVAKRMAFAMPLQTRARLRKMEVDLRAGKVLSADSQTKLVDALKSLHDLAEAGGVDPANLGPNDDEDAPSTHEDGSEGGASAGSDGGVVYVDGSGARMAPATATERREQSMSYGDRQSAVYQALLTQLDSGSGDDGDGECDEFDIWIRDMGDDWVVWHSYREPHGDFRLSYSIDADGAVTLSGDPEQVATQTTYVPVAAPDDGDTATGETRDAVAADDAPGDEPAPMTSSTLRLLVEAGRQPAA